MGESVVENSTEEREVPFQLGNFRVAKYETGYLVQGQEPVTIWNGEVRENWSKHANRIPGLRMPIVVYRKAAEEYGGRVSNKGSATFACPAAAQKFIEDFLAPHFLAVSMSGVFRWKELNLEETHD